MNSETLVIRADAGVDIGVGHVMRCLGLAQAWQDAGGNVVFAMASGNGEIGKRLRSEGMDTAELAAAPGSKQDAVRCVELCGESSAVWLVLDGFHFDYEYRRRVRNAAAHLMVVDDHGKFAPYECDAVLNTNPYASDQMYPQRDGRVHFFLGANFALLRREFLAQPRQNMETPSTARRILITFGGSDPNNVTLLAVEALRHLTDLELDPTVVLGSSNPHRRSIEQSIEHVPRAQVLVAPENMPKLMARAELAISAGGGTCYELAFERVPMFLITMAKNHEETVNAWAEQRAAMNAGWFDRLDSKSLAAQLRSVICDQALRNELTDRAAKMVDGLGARRVVETMVGTAMRSVR